jgi:excisionase family DNA binding protein
MSKADRVTYTAAEVAAKTGISRSSVYQLLDRGEIPAVRVGRRRLIPASWVETLDAARDDHGDGA